MERSGRGVITHNEFHRATHEEKFEGLKNKARHYCEIASIRHELIRYVARESWKRALSRTPESQREQYISAQRARIIRFYIKPYLNQGVHPGIKENDEILGVGFYVDSKDQPRPSIRDIDDPLAFFDFDKWEPLKDRENATMAALNFLADTERYDEAIKADYYPDFETTDLTIEERAELAEIENSVDNYLFRRQEEQNHL